METSPLAIPSVALLLALYFFFHHLFRRKAPKLPPGPPPIPVIGNLHQLGNFSHRSLSSLAKSYGPIMFLRLGNKPTIVISSPEAAELVLKTHDSVFSNRPTANTVHHLAYGNKGVSFGKIGAYWRGARRLCIQVLNPASVVSFAPMRREEVERVVGRVRAAAAAREAVDMSAEVGQLIGDLACRMILGRSTRDTFNLRPVIHEAMNLSGAFNLADYLPLFRALDLQGMARRAKAVNRALDKVFEDIIVQHEKDTTGKYKGDFIDTLLTTMGHPINSSTLRDEPVHLLERSNIKAIAYDMIAAAYDTTASVIEWALSELVRKPRVMKHLQQELEAIVGLDRTVEESDLPKLNYLDMVVKEALRLYPPGPLLIPHECTESIEICGYYIPKRTRVIVNVWALGRDTDSWGETAEEFLPERFANSSVDVKGQHFQLIPFGSGRRVCPGMNTGLLIARLVLAQLLHCFDWELPEGTSPDELDMSEEFGLTMPRAKHLIMRPTFRLRI